MQTRLNDDDDRWWCWWWLTGCWCWLQSAQNKEPKMKRPCTGYMLFMSDFLKSNDAKTFRDVKQAVSEGTQLSLLPSAEWKTSSSIRPMRWRPTVWLIGAVVWLHAVPLVQGRGNRGVRGGGHMTPLKFTWGSNMLFWPPYFLERNIFWYRTHPHVVIEATSQLYYVLKLGLGD